MEAFVLGLTTGGAAGVSPGPLMVLVVTQTLRSGWRAGVLTAAAPLVTDAVVVAGTLLVLDRLPTWALPVLGVLGGLYVAWLGIETWRSAGDAMPTPATTTAPTSGVLRRAALVNLLSPHPWIAWAVVLGPLVLRTWDASPLGAVALVVGFYVALVGAKAVVAVLVAGGRTRLTPRTYAVVMRVAALALVVVGLALLAEFGPAAAETLV